MDPRTGFLELYSRRDGTTLCSPHEDGTPIALYAHQDCGPNRGYAIPLCRITTTDWMRQISEKVWCASLFLAAIAMAPSDFAAGDLILEPLRAALGMR